MKLALTPQIAKTLLLWESTEIFDEARGIEKTFKNFTDHEIIEYNEKLEGLCKHSTIKEYLHRFIECNVTIFI